MKMEQTECSETSAYKIQTPGKYQEDSIQNTAKVWNQDYIVIFVHRLVLKNNSYKINTAPRFGDRVSLRSQDKSWTKTYLFGHDRQFQPLGTLSPKRDVALIACCYLLTRDNRRLMESVIRNVIYHNQNLLQLFWVCLRTTCTQKIWT